jgi:hypothetical protein
LLRKDVWAILTQQADGGWRVVNCLDKHDACFRLDCAFTDDQGTWPYKAAAADPVSDKRTTRYRPSGAAS